MKIFLLVYPFAVFILTLKSNTHICICSIITVVILLCHFDFCTPMRKTVWPKAFGPHGKIELWILLFFTVFWCISVWFNTTIRGPGGEGKEQYNLYFSSWLCLWASMWTLERWCTCTGRASFERFVKSWPNRKVRVSIVLLCKCLCLISFGDWTTSFELLCLHLVVLQITCTNTS